MNWQYRRIEADDIPFAWAEKFTAKTSYSAADVVGMVRDGTAVAVGMFEDGELRGVAVSVWTLEFGRRIITDSHVWVDREHRHKGALAGHLEYIKGLAAQAGAELRIVTHADEQKWDRILAPRGFRRKLIVWEAT